MDTTPDLDLEQFTGHTAGCWRAEQQRHGLSAYIFCGDHHGGIHIANVHPNGDETLPNAQLIAAAPALLAELKSLRAERDDLLEVLADKRRLTRELDVALSGEEGAAKQASLCDLIGVAKSLRAERDTIRDKAIDECVKVVSNAIDPTRDEIISRLEALKGAETKT